MMKVLKITVIYDGTSESPCDADGNWQLYSFLRGDKNYVDPDSYDEDETASLQEKLAWGLAFQLDYSEHGPHCRWHIANKGTPDPWDSTRFSGLLVWEEPEENIGAKTYNDREKDAEGFLEEYTAWCNGDSYLFKIEEVPGVPDDYDVTAGVDGFKVKKKGDWYGGLIGPDSLMDAIVETIGEDELNGATLAFEGDACHVVDNNDLNKALGRKAAEKTR